MEVHTFGNVNNEKALFFHPMFTNFEFFKNLIDKLKDEFFLIIPTFSGHYEGSVYSSMEQEEKQLDEFLHNSGIDKIKFLVGFSLGGNIAFDYFCKHSDMIDKVVVDSAPLFNFPKFIKRHFYNKYKKCIERVRQNPENAADELNKNFHGMGNAQKDVAQIVKTESLKGLIESCYNVHLPKLTESQQAKIVFVYGTKDIARLCLPRIKRYRYSKIIKLKGLNHCEYFMNCLDAYLDKIVR